MPRLIGNPASSIWNAAQYAGQQVGSFVAADPSTLPLPTRPMQAAARFTCERWSNAPGSVKSITLTGPILDDVCSQYLGNNGWDLPVPGSIPFQGGQCPTTYSMTLSWDDYSGPNYERTDVGGSNVTGPIDDIRIVFNPFDPGDPNGLGIWFTLAIAQGGNVIFDQRQGRGDKTTSWVDNVQLVSLSRVDGLPDDCGDLPTPPPGPGPNPAPPPNNNFTINLGGFNPQITVGEIDVDIDGKISVPVDIDNDITLDLFGDKGGGSVNGRFPTEAGPTQDTNVSGEIQAEEGRFIRAVDVTVVDPFNSGTDIGLQGGEILTIPRHANVTFESSSGYETDPFSVRLLGQRIECPFIEGATRVRVTPAPGARLFFTLIYFEE